MNWSTHPSAYGYVPPATTGHRSPNPPAQGGILNTGRVEIERKTFFISLKENPRGRLLRITEQSVNHHSSIMIPSTGLKEFQTLLGDMLEEETNAALKPLLQTESGRGDTKLEILQSIREFVAEDLRVPLASLTAATRLLQDLGLDGNASEDFMRHYSEHFHVDLSGFRTAYHFQPEPVRSAFWKVFSYLFERDHSRDVHDVPITLQDLVEAAHTGTWKVALANRNPSPPW